MLGSRNQLLLGMFAASFFFAVPAFGQAQGELPAELRLSISPAEANLLLEALGQLPFARVGGLVGKIQTQARQQLQPAKKEEVSAPKRPEIFDTYRLAKVGGKTPADAGLTGPYLTALKVARIDRGGESFDLQGTMTLSDGQSLQFNGNMRKGPATTTWWQGVMSSAPTDTQKGLAYSITLAFYTQDFRNLNASVTVLTVDNAATFRQTGAAVWAFEKK